MRKHGSFFLPVQTVWRPRTGTSSVSVLYFASESRVQGFGQVCSKLHAEFTRAIVRRLSWFSLSFQKLGFSLAKRENPASPAGAQEGRHQWFPPSDFLPFPKIIWCKPETGDRCEKENGRGFFLSCRSLTIRNVRYLAATQAVSSPQARHKVNCPKGKRGSPGG